MKGIQSNGFLPIIARALKEMEEIHGEFSSIDEVNLAELGCQSGLLRSKLRRLKENGFCEKVARSKWAEERTHFGSIQFCFGMHC